MRHTFGVCGKGAPQWDLSTVMPGLVPGIHVFTLAETGMAGTNLRPWTIIEGFRMQWDEFVHPVGKAEAGTIPHDTNDASIGCSLPAASTAMIAFDGNSGIGRIQA